MSTWNSNNNNNQHHQHHRSVESEPSELQSKNKRGTATSNACTSSANNTKSTDGAQVASSPGLFDSSSGSGTADTNADPSSTSRAPDVFEWMRDRQNAFRDFTNSSIGPLSSSIFSDTQSPLSKLHSYHPNPPLTHPEFAPIFHSRQKPPEPVCSLLQCQIGNKQ